MIMLFSRQQENKFYRTFKKSGKIIPGPKVQAGYINALKR